MACILPAFTSSWLDLEVPGPLQSPPPELPQLSPWQRGSRGPPAWPGAVFSMWGQPAANQMLQDRYVLKSQLAQQPQAVFSTGTARVPTAMRM